MSDLYNSMDAMERNIRTKAQNKGKRDRLQRLAAFVLCMALFANTIPMDVLAAQGSVLPEDVPSVSMSDPGLLRDMTAAAPAPASSSEYIQLQVTVPGNHYSDGTLTLDNTGANFVIEPTLNGSTVNTPVLKISIPSCMEVTYYPDEANEHLKGQLTDPVSKEEQDGYTIMTYRFNPQLTRVSFAINARIPSGYHVQSGNSYQIRLELYDGDTPLASETEDFSIALKEGKISLSDAMQKSCTIYEDTASYYVGPYTWHLSSNSDHYPYTSLKMIVPLPSGAIPGTGGAHDLLFTALPDNTPRSFSGYTITYCPDYHYQSDDKSVRGQANVLIYELTPGNKFLMNDDSITFNLLYSDELYLRFTNPESRIYQSPASPRIECEIGGQTVTMLDYGTTNLTSVTFNELIKETTIRPDKIWRSIIYLKENVSVYDTATYLRGIYIDSTVPVTYDSLKMTVPLPEGAVPGFEKDAAFIPLVDGTTEPLNDDRTMLVTYHHNQSYSNADGSVQGNADTLAFEFCPFEAQEGSSNFEFWGSKSLHLRFNNPSAGTYQSAASPKIEATLNGKTTTMYDFNATDYLTFIDFVEPQEDDGAYPDFDVQGGKGWKDTIILEEDKTVYYTKPYDRAVYSSLSHYPYDLVRMTVLLPDEAVPGFGTEESFAPLKDGETYTNTIQPGAPWTVTYHEQYPYANKEGTVKGSAKVLVYEIPSELSPSNYFLTGGNYFPFTWKQPEQILHLQFTDPEPKTYYSAASPKVEYIMDGKLYVADGYFSQTESDTSVTFEPRRTDWSQLLVSGSTNKTLYDLDKDHFYGHFDFLIPEEYQNNKEYYGFITNNTGDPLKSIRILYEFDKDLNVDKLTFHLGESGYPANAVVTYTTALDGTEQTARLNASDNVLTLETGNAFMTAEVTYDALDASDTSRKVLTASLHNYRKIPASDYTQNRDIKTTALSADSETCSSDDSLTSSDTTTVYILNESKRLSLNSWISSTILTKGTDFTVRVSCMGGYYHNLVLYFRMPKGYILTDYTPPGECKDGEYHLTSRILEDGDLLYCLEYTDDIMHKMYHDGCHYFSFHIGLEADTSFYQEISLPKAVYATVEENALYQFSSMYMRTESDIGLDVNGDGDMEDSFYTPSTTTVKINPLELIDINGYLSAEDQIGESQNKEYTCNSVGNYHSVLWNGLASGTSLSDADITFTLPRKGSILTYNGTEYISQYDVLLAGPVKPQGDFWEGCSVQYSADGLNWLTEDEVSDYPLISYIKVRSAAGRILNSAESVFIDFPFTVDFPNNGIVENAYIDLYMQYDLNTASDNPQTSHKFNTLTTKPVEFYGMVYQDRNHNGKQDADELSNDKTYHLKLYSGEGTDGTLLQEISTDSTSGKYNFDIFFPGTYTLHVERDGDELYGASNYFDENGNYSFTLDSNIPAPATRRLNMGMLMPFTLEKPQYSVFPASPDGRDGWYVTLPQVTLVPRVSSPDVNTMFWHDGETAQKLTPATFPSVTETGTYAFKAYNEMVSAAGAAPVRSDTASLDLKVDVDVPVIKDVFSCSIADGSNINAAGNFLPFGNFFNRSVQITVTAEDVGSGIDSLYYTLPGGQMQSVKPDSDGYLRFNIPMDTAGKITYYVEDRAGNKSETIALKKENGSEWWEIEDRPPVWEPIVLTDINGSAGVLGADGNVWFAASVNASAQVIDEDSGLAHITSRINETPAAVLTLNGNGKQAAFPFTTTVETEGRILLQAEAEDNATNTAATQTTFGIDRTAPVIVLENKFLSMTQGEQLLVLASEEQFPALASKEQLSVTTPEEPLPALASKDIGALADDTPIATVLVRDTGSGVDPDSIRVMWQGQEIDFQVTPAPAEGGYRLTFPMVELAYTDSGDAYLISAKDYTGWSAELPITRYQEQIIYVAADTGSDVTGDGSRTYPVQTLEAALERVRPGGMIVLLENYNGTAYVNLDVTLDLNGKVLHSDVPGSAITVGPAGSLTIMDSNGLASAAEGFGRDPESEGEIFGGIPGDPAFTLEGGSLTLTDGTIYCGYTGDGSVQVLDDARMMYLLTYLNGGGTGEAPGLHYIEEHTTDALKQNTFSREGYTFRGWLYEDQLYYPGQEILMPGRNMVTLAKWAKEDGVPGETAEETEENRTLDSVPKTGNGQNRQGGHSSTPHTDNRMELYIKVRKKEDEQNTEN